MNDTPRHTPEPWAAVRNTAYWEIGTEIDGYYANRIGDDERRAFFDAVLPLPERGNESGSELEKILKRERRVKEQRREVIRITRDMEDPSVLWGLLQGATRWAQHDRTVKGASTNPDARAYSNLPGGSAYEFSVNAQSAALALV